VRCDDPSSRDAERYSLPDEDICDGPLQHPRELTEHLERVAVIAEGSAIT